jgi:non-heme chloroperoxidase
MKTKYLELDNVKIAYYEYGSGQNLLLIHGNLQNKSAFKKHQIEYFNNFHTFAVDSRGFGQSISKDNKYSIEQYSEDIMNFCKKLGINKTYVIGFSDGGNICLFLAQKYPEIFTKIVAISPNYLVSGLTDETLKTLNKIYKIFLFLLKIKLPMKKAISKWELMMKDIGITDEKLKNINANMEIIYAENDLIKEEHILKIGELIKNCSVKKIGNCTHSNIFKNEEAIKEIIEFLN